MNIHAWEIQLDSFQELRFWQRCCATPFDHTLFITPLMFRQSVTLDAYFFSSKYPCMQTQKEAIVIYLNAKIAACFSEQLYFGLFWTCMSAHVGGCLCSLCSTVYRKKICWKPSWVNGVVFWAVGNWQLACCMPICLPLIYSTLSQLDETPVNGRISGFSQRKSYLSHRRFVNEFSKIDVSALSCNGGRKGMVCSWNEASTCQNGCFLK